MAGRKILKVRNALSSFQLHGFVALHHDAKFRLDEFDAALAYAGLGRDALADWRVRLTERPLRNEELRHPDAAPDHPPLEIGRKIDRKSVVEGKSVAVTCDLWDRRTIKKKKQKSIK